MLTLFSVGCPQVVVVVGYMMSLISWKRYETKELVQIDQMQLEKMTKCCLKGLARNALGVVPTQFLKPPHRSIAIPPRGFEQTCGTSQLWMRPEEPYMIFSGLKEQAMHYPP